MAMTVKKNFILDVTQRSLVLLYQSSEWKNKSSNKQLAR
jgi:hypothetical protein